MEDFPLYQATSTLVLVFGGIVTILLFIFFKFVWNPSRKFWQRTQYAAICLISLSFMMLAIEALPQIVSAWNSFEIATVMPNAWLILTAAILLQVLTLLARSMPHGVRLKTKTEQAVKVADKRTNSNEHIEEYLDFYLARENKTDFAVMINGAWGVGKTTYIKEKLSNLGCKVIYVSLNGVSDQNQISQLILTQMYPILGSKVAKISSRLLAGALRFEIPVEPLGANTNLEFDTSRSKENSSDLFNTARQDYIYIFDDLERSKLSAIEILGFVNHYVEHENLKVIVIANEAHLLKERDEQSQAYALIKEKTIGQTLTFEPNGVEVYKAIISDLLINRDDLVSKTIKDYTLEIYTQFAACEESNLRTLRQALLICRRILDSLDSDLVTRSSFSLEVIQITIVLKILASRSKLEINDLAGVREISILSLPDDEVNPAFQRARQAEVLLSQADPNLIFGHSFWNELIFKGKLDVSEMNQTAKSYLNPVGSDTPTWYRLMRFAELSDDSFSQLLSKAVDELYDNASGLSYMDVLQTAGVLLDIADKELTDIEPHQIEENAKLYLDFLLSRDKIPPQFYREFMGIEDVVALGFGLRGKNSQELQSIFRYFEEKQEESRNYELKRLAKELPRRIKDDFEFVYRKFQNPGEMPYIDYPILQYVNVGDLVTALADRTVGDELQTFIKILRKRYHGSPKSLVGELTFLLELRAHIIANYGDDIKTLTAVIWRESLQNIIEPAIKKLEIEKNKQEN